MSQISRRSLFAKLNPTTYQSIESATTFCKMRGNPYVELLHWYHQILQIENNDLQLIIRHFGLNPSRLAADLTGSLDRLPRGANSILDFSPHLEDSIMQGWMYASLQLNEAKIRSGHLLLGGLRSPSIRGVILGISGEFARVKPDELSDQFQSILATSCEAVSGAESNPSGAQSESSTDAGTFSSPQMGKLEALKKYAVDLTEKARSGKLDPIVGRDDEVRQIVDILMRRRQNNPILTGEAGVGKTAVVEGFAQRIVQGDVPPALKEVSVFALDLGLLQAGASMKGEFEQRLRQLIEEVQSSPKPIILFIDEAHTLIGAGGAAGQNDAANLLKPALARGTLRTIAATTWAEYKKYFEKDPALTRRFQVIKVEEPSEHKATLMLRGVASILEKHHRVQLLDEAIESAVRLSHRYIPARQLPDKAVSLLDTACARVAVSQHAVPPEVDNVYRQIQSLETELEILKRESVVGVNHADRLAGVQTKLQGLRAEHEKLKQRWDTEKTVVNQILELRAKLRSQSAEPIDSPGVPAGAVVSESTPESRRKDLESLRALESQLQTLQGEHPLVLPNVGTQAIAAVVADWTGIPVGRMVKDEIKSILTLADTLEKRVIGQRHALEIITRRVQTSRANLDNPNRPIGVFMLAGPSGVGKTETALTLAESLYGGEHNLITINMSEFQEPHTVSTLKGSPPGYVGYGEGGILTEAVRRKPYSVVLLDEVEKAHPDVHELFFQVFDKGWMEDGEGREIDFKNTIIILTSNAGQDLIVNMCKDPDLLPTSEGLEKALRGPLTKVFPDALLNRLVVVPYYPISKEMLQQIIRLQLSRVQKRVETNHKVPFTFDASVPELIATRCTELERGARMVDAMITNQLLPEIGGELLRRMMEAEPIGRVHVAVTDGKFNYSFN